MLKQKSRLIFSVVSVIAFILLFFILLTDTPITPHPLTTDQTPNTQEQWDKSDVVIGLSNDVSDQCDILLTSDSLHSDSRVFSYRENVTPLIERKISLWQDSVCHYGLFQINSTPVALFYVKTLSGKGTEKLTHLIRCYVDYYPLAIIGNFTEDSTTLLHNVAELESVCFDSTTILTANLTLMHTRENVLIGKTKAPPKSLDLNRPMVAITYDDGPSPFTPKVLDSIVKHNAKATFYTLGVQAELYPETIRAIFQSGCEIGNHTNLHEVFSKNTAGIIQKTVNEANRKLFEILGIGAATVRPPTGAIHDRNGNNVEIGFPIILWSIDTRDFENNSNENAVLSMILSNLTDGAIILMHDTHEATANVTDTIFKEVLSAGFQTVSVSELLEFKFGGASANSIYKGNTVPRS